MNLRPLSEGGGGVGSGGAGQPWGIPSLITGVEEKIVLKGIHVIMSKLF